MKYPHTFDVYQRLKTLDSMGGESFAWTLRLSSVTGRFYQTKQIGELKKKDTGETELFDYRVMTSTSIAVGERLLKGSIYYEVMTVYDVAGSRTSHHYQLDVRQI